MSLNEFLKEHRKNEKQESKIEAAGGENCASAKADRSANRSLQKVSDQLEASKPAPQVVNNP
jgi:hypothetical protein